MGPWELEENPDEDPKLKLKDCWASAGDAVETTAMIPSERMLFIENFMFVFIVVHPSKQNGRVLGREDPERVYQK